MIIPTLGENTNMTEILSDSSSFISKETVDEEEQWRGFKSEKVKTVEKATKKKNTLYEVYGFMSRNRSYT